VLNRTRLLAVARKEATQLRRDARSLYLAFLLPALLVVLFGYAISWDVDDIRTAVDQDGCGSRAARRLPRLGYFTFARLGGAADRPALYRGGDLARVIPPALPTIDAGERPRSRRSWTAAPNTAPSPWGTPGPCADVRRLDPGGGGHPISPGPACGTAS
jgi:hypothetical protein